MPYDKKKGKLAHLPPSPAYKTVLALRALRASSASSMDIAPSVRLVTGGERRPPAKGSSRSPVVGGLPAVPSGKVTVPRGNSHLLPPPSRAGAPQDHKPRPLPRKPITPNAISSTNPSHRLAAQQLRAIAPRHQVPREVLEISVSSTRESSLSSSSSCSSSSSSSSSSYLSLQPSGPSWDEPVPQTSPTERCFFDDVLEDHIRAHERYIRKGGRVNPRSLYATLPTNVADLAAHLGLATSHIRSEASPKPSSKGIGGHDSLANRTSCSSKATATSTYMPETVDRFANHGPTRVYPGTKAVPLGTSRKSNGQQVDEIESPQAIPSAGASTRTYATPKRQRPRQADRHQPGSAQSIKTPSNASPHPMRLRPRQADHHDRLRAPYDIRSLAAGGHRSAWDVATPDSASPSPHSRFTALAGGQAARLRAHQLFPPPGLIARNESTRPDSKCGLVINDFFSDPPCPDVLKDDSHEVLRQVQDFLNSQMRRAQAVPPGPGGLPNHHGHPWAR
ncbi:hypothetical protein BCV69DRAFT_3049 [Microstroma glucosiphilum]|uniref:Uncharacterized protein n=1 Tax=Pseudomicrostroma glucosiphilum TaxID=1684307 RepID=A0A316UE56_9BASI|nr:hypothetical protein BCV69DRAFT_3049 [Pseudomicrostroma glucosiphilum]PWN23557.1 hypothetical protein BCV69DRAFT_3049 [Pseudomicrostroma glucosiphilum]